MFLPIILYASHLQARQVISDFRVSQVGPSGQKQEVGTSRLSTILEPSQHALVSWEFTSLDRKTGWRKDYEFGPKGEVLFQSYETSFGELKTRWILARENGEWKVRGDSNRTPPAKDVRCFDPSALWFLSKKPKVGSKAEISSLDSGSFRVRKGQVRYLRDENRKIGRKALALHVIQRTFDDEIQVSYVDDFGRTVRLEMVFPKATMSMEFESIEDR